MDERPILVVEDDPSILEAIATLFELKGYDVLTARDGAEALRLMERRMPRLVVLDMLLPRVNGWEFTYQLRALGIHVPVLVMTALNDPEYCATEVGAAGFVAKPFEVGELLQQVEHMQRAA